MAKLVYGLYRYTVNVNGIEEKKVELRHIDEVERGLACNCFCPDRECRGKLVGRQGEINEHHFAHYDLAECEYGYRIGILKQAELILEESKHIMLPIIELDGDKLKLVDTGKNFRLGYTETNVLESCIKTRRRAIYSVIEISRDDIRLIIELRFAKVSKEVIDKYKNNGQSALVIYLDDLKDDSPDGLYKILIDSIDNKAWIYNDKKEKELEIKRNEKIQQIMESSSTKNKCVDTSGYIDKGRLIFQQQKEKKERVFLESWEQRGICPHCSSGMVVRKIGKDISIKCSNRSCGFKMFPDWESGEVKYKENLLKVPEWCMREYERITNWVY